MASYVFDHYHDQCDCSNASLARELAVIKLLQMDMEVSKSYINLFSC